MESKFLVFKEVHPVDEKTGKLKDLKTKCFVVYSRRDLEHAYGLNKHAVCLGSISFYPAWRKYVYWPEADTIYDSSCLNDIAAFCEEQTAKWRESKKKKSHTEELITEPFIVKDEKTVEKLLDVLESPGKEIKPNPNIKEISAEELWEIIDKVAKEVYEKTKKR